MLRPGVSQELSVPVNWDLPASGKEALWGWREGRRGWKSFGEECPFLRACLVAQMVKNLPAVWETWVQSPCWKGPLEKE